MALGVAGSNPVGHPFPRRDAVPHYQRFIQADARPLDLARLEASLRKIDPAWSVARREDRVSETAALLRADDRFGDLEINRPGEEIFREEIEELIEIAEYTPGPKQDLVLDRLRKAKALVVLDVRWGDREREETRTALEPLWRLLLTEHEGLKHEDGEGFSDATGVILQIR